jgi:hypothetical protein
LLALVSTVACSPNYDSSARHNVAPLSTVDGANGTTASSGGTTPPASPPPPARSAISVRGNQLVDGTGATFRMLGVNHTGGEYMCIGARGIFDSPADDALVSAIVAWNVNTVRLGLNEHCWLGWAGGDARYTGQPYRDAVGAFVKKLRARGLYVVLELHWSSSILGNAKKQQPMLDAKNGLPFWSGVAQAFSSDKGVVFDVYNEPFLDTTNTANAFNGDPWQCWLVGCTVSYNGETYAAAGMQPVIDAIRATGARNVILLGGNEWANDVTGVTAHMPTDPLSQLAVSFHVYANNRCVDEACWNGALAGVAARVPVVTGEVGEFDCQTAFVKSYFAWADARNMSYLGWTFNPGDCGNLPSLVTDWKGTPTAYGAALRDHLAALAASP